MRSIGGRVDDARGEGGRRPCGDLLDHGGKVASDMRVRVDGVRVRRGPEAHEEEAETILAEGGPVAFEEAGVKVEQVAGVDEERVVRPEFVAR